MTSFAFGESISVVSGSFIPTMTKFLFLSISDSSILRLKVKELFLVP